MPKAARLTVEPIVLQDIETSIDIEAMLMALRIDGNPGYADMFRSMVSEAAEVVRAKALYKAVFFDAGNDDNVVINGTALKSRVLRVNLEGAYRVFPFVATCGTELEAWADTKTDMLENFWTTAIRQSALGSAIHALRKHIEEKYRLEKTALMTPGSLEDWPIEEQAPLFTILGDIRSLIGVEVTRGLMMKPVHSVSGILFPTEVSFESCQLCPREDCPNRRAPYDPHLAIERYDKI